MSYPSKLGASNIETEYHSPYASSIELEYHIQVLKQGKDAVHKEFHFNGLTFQAVEIKNESDRYRSFTDKLPLNTSRTSYIKHPIEAFKLYKYQVLINDKAVKSNTDILSAFHEFNLSYDQTHFDTICHELSSLMTTRALSSSLFNRKITQIYLKSIWLRGQEATHREFFIENSQIYIGKSWAKYRNPQHYFGASVVTYPRPGSIYYDGTTSLARQVQEVVNADSTKHEVDKLNSHLQSKFADHLVKQRVECLLQALRANRSVAQHVMRREEPQWEDEIYTYLSQFSVLELIENFKAVQQQHQHQHQHHDNEHSNNLMKLLSLPVSDTANDGPTLR